MQKKNNKGLIAVIIALFLLIIGLLCYIILDKNDANNNDETSTTNTTTTETTTTKKALYSGDADGVFRLKVEHNKLYIEGEDYDSYWKYAPNSYYIYTDLHEIKLQYTGRSYYFYIDGKNIAIKSDVENYLKTFKWFKDYLVVFVGLPFNDYNYIIDLKNNKVIDGLCFPDNNGKCIHLDYIGSDNDNVVYETEYNVDFNDEYTETIVNKEKFFCDDYEKYYMDGCDGDYGSNACERAYYCFSPE